MRILTLSGEQVHSLSDMKECLDTMAGAFKRLGEGEVESPLRVRIPMSSVRNILFMPSLIRGGLNNLSLKIVSVYPDIGAGRPSLNALVALIDGNDGTTKAIMDGASLTSIRTGAVSGLSCRYLARKDSETVGIIGAGGQAFQQVNAVAAALRIKQVKMFSLEPERTQALAERCKAELGLQSTICESADEVARDTDVLVTATTSKNPVFDGRLVRQGTHVISMGAYTPDAREADSYFASKASIYVDSVDAAWQEAGDLLIPMREGVIDRNSIKGDMAGLVLGKVKGRSDPREITWFKSVGLALEDNAIGWLIYNRAQSRGIGSWVEI
jgi:ornithine cyclodeaminase/alanine dehydrogenase-like protein (mu-crystallin family)